MSWTLRPAGDSFARYREMWDALNRANGNHLLLDSAFVALLLRHFGSPRVRLAISGDPERPGLALLEKVRPGIWQTFQPSQAPLGMIVLGSRHDVPGQMRGLIRSLPGYALGLAVLHQDPDYTAFADLPPRPDVEIVEYIRTARVTFAGTFDDYWSARDRRFVRDLARRRRRLIETGVRPELSVTRDPAQVAEAIREYGLLEAAGWKAKLGTAISADNLQGRFYRELLEHFCKRGEGVVYRLILGGKTAAANLCVARDGMLIVLKTTYDESLQSSSPGRLLDEDMRRALFAEGRIKVEEYYGPFDDAQGKWTGEVRTLYHVNFYRSAAVRKLQRAFKLAWAKLRVRPAPSRAPR
ncbi:MAG: GNAT family N-acetyltransferase [Candidatus Rokuibacteriota bacterium]